MSYAAFTRLCASFAASWPSPSRFLLRPSLPRRIPSSSRHYSAGPNGRTGSSTSRAERILSRLPPYLQKYTRGLHDAPVSHAVAFLILHEITAIVPLFGLFGLFHYSSYVPIDYMMGHYGGQVAEGVRRFEKYFRRKGWFGFGDADADTDGLGGQAGQDTPDSTDNVVREHWTRADAKYKIVVEVGLAYVITKALLPVRIVFSVWATPWFAGVLARLRRLRGPSKGP